MRKVVTPGHITMGIDEWYETYRPVRNVIAENPSFDMGEGGLMFETYGKEVEYVLDVDRETPANVWTYMDGEDDPVIVNGYHLVNRIGYFITEVPAIDGVHYDVSLDD
jgi:hypothetical protein